MQSAQSEISKKLEAEKALALQKATTRQSRPQVEGLTDLCGSSDSGDAEVHGVRGKKDKGKIEKTKKGTKRGLEQTERSQKADSIEDEQREEKTEGEKDEAEESSKKKEDGEYQIENNCEVMEPDIYANEDEDEEEGEEIEEEEEEVEEEEEEFGEEEEEEDSNGEGINKGIKKSSQNYVKIKNEITTSYFHHLKVNGISKSTPLKASNKYKILKKQGRKMQNLKGKQFSDSKLNFGTKRCHNMFCKFPFKGELKRFKIKFTNEYIHLCQKCTDRFKQKNYCLYCGQVYYDSNEVDGNLWIGCEECNLWLHQECEKKNGIKDIDTLVQDNKYTFYCLRCREKHKQQNGDKLAFNILKAKQQVDNCLNGGEQPSQQSAGITAASMKLNKRVYKKNKEKQSCIKNKGKALIANFKQLKGQIFAPKPGVPQDEGSSNHTFEQAVIEPRKHKKICTEDNRGITHFKASPHCQSSSVCAERIHHTPFPQGEQYSSSLFLKAKRQMQIESLKSQNREIEINEENIQNSQGDPQIQNGDPILTQNNHHHHRGRKDDPYIELPYKKQTFKEVASKKVQYHYSILQELLHPLSLSLTLSQEDINEDLQVYRSIAMDGKRLKEEDVHATTPQQIDDSSLIQGQLSTSSQQPSENNDRYSSPTFNTNNISKAGIIIDSSKNRNSEDFSKQQLNAISPIISQH